ncbi:MAG: bifunctional metallophosphatase/5'-nucleotidase [Selenomonadaceae bacterium]|nr:bifunctional metallophosphatase/5'-nucleotidase [Selenomonadaceae bacterium]
MQFTKMFIALITAMVFLIAPIASAEEIVFFHTNDMHSRLLETDDGKKSIGLAVLASYINNFKKSNPSTLWFDAGDTLHGMPMINISRGENMVKLLNAAGLDAMTPGNHDFNYSAERLTELAKKCKFPVITSNVFWKKDGKRLLKSSKIFTLKNGVKIGVFGLTTPETLYKANPVYMGKLKFEDTVEIAKQEIKALKPNCDIIVAISHLGIDESSIIKSTDVAKAAPGIDVIIDGHSHTELPSGIVIGGTLIAQTGCYEHNLGKVTIDYENKRIVSKKAELLNKSAVNKVVSDKKSGDFDKLLAPDEKVISALKVIERENKAILNEKICEIPKSLSADREIIRRSEAEIGDLLTDSFVWSTGADAAIVNSGTIRADLKAGVVTRGDILSVFPFGNIVEVRKVSGKTLRLALEHSVRYYPSTAGGFLQVSGITFDYDPKLPQMRRVKNVTIKGAPLDDNAVYNIASLDFIFNGGDGYSMLKNLPLEKSYASIEEVFVKFIRQNQNLNFKFSRINRL